METEILEIKKLVKSLTERMDILANDVKQLSTKEALNRAGIGQSDLGLVEVLANGLKKQGIKRYEGKNFVLEVK